MIARFLRRYWSARCHRIQDKRGAGRRTVGIRLSVTLTDRQAGTSALPSGPEDPSSAQGLAGPAPVRGRDQHPGAGCSAQSCRARRYAGGSSRWSNPPPSAAAGRRPPRSASTCRRCARRWTAISSCRRPCRSASCPRGAAPDRKSSETLLQPSRLIADRNARHDRRDAQIAVADPLVAQGHAHIVLDCVQPVRARNSPCPLQAADASRPEGRAPDAPAGWHPVRAGLPAYFSAAHWDSVGDANAARSSTTKPIFQREK